MEGCLSRVKFNSEEQTTPATQPFSLSLSHLLSPLLIPPTTTIRSLCTPTFRSFVFECKIINFLLGLLACFFNSAPALSRSRIFLMIIPRRAFAFFFF